MEFVEHANTGPPICVAGTFPTFLSHHVNHEEALTDRLDQSGYWFLSYQIITPKSEEYVRPIKKNCMFTY